MNIAKEAMMDMYLRMVRIREFENKAQSLFAEGKIPGFVHLYLGEEAVATGVCECLRDDDYITSTHRGHGHIIAKGGDLKYMMAELFGKATGYCKGKGGSMHIADRDRGILGANGQVTSLAPGEVCMGIVTVTLLAFIAAGIGVVYQIERLPLLSATAIHAGALYLDYLLIYLLNNWIPRDWAFIGVFTLCFAVGYALIWGIILLSIRHRTNRINRHLRGGKS